MILNLVQHWARLLNFSGSVILRVKMEEIMPPCRGKVRKIWCKEHLAPGRHTLNVYVVFLSLFHHPMFSWTCSLLHHLTRLSGSSDSWQETKAIFSYSPNELKWKLAIEQVQLQEKTLEQNQTGSIRSPIHEANTFMLCQGHVHLITLRTSLPEQLDVFYWGNDFSLCVSVSALVFWLGNKYVRPFVGRKKNANMTFSFTILPEASSCSTCISM